MLMKFFLGKWIFFLTEIKKDKGWIVGDKSTKYMQVHVYDGIVKREILWQHTRSNPDFYPVRGGVLELFGNFTMWIYDPEVWIFQGGSIGPFLSRTPDSLLNLRMGNCLESFAIINSIKSVISCYQCPLYAKHAEPESTGNFIYVIKPFKNVGLPRK